MEDEDTFAAEAEAGRAARAKVITADGEMRSSRALAQASDVIEKSPAAIQLRYLQVSSLCNPPIPPHSHPQPRSLSINM